MNYGDICFKLLSFFNEFVHTSSDPLYLNNMINYSIRELTRFTPPQS